MTLRKAADLKTGPAGNTRLGYLVPKNKESTQGIIGLLLSKPGTIKHQSKC